MAHRPGQHRQPQEVAQIVGQHEELQLDPDLEYQKRTFPRQLLNRLILRAVRMLTAANFFPFDSIVPLRAGGLGGGFVLSHPQSFPGLGTNRVNISGSSLTNRAFAPVNTSGDSFFRLIYP